MKSEYRSSKSVAKNKTVPISADDPRLAPDKIAQTRARQGAEIEVIGLDGKSLITGGTGTNSPRGTSSNSSIESSRPNIVVPGINGATPYEVGYGAIVPTDITNVVTEWIGEDLKVTFDWDYQDDANKSVSEFILEITADGVTRQTPYGSFLVNRTQTGQTANFTKSLNRTTLGIFRTSITNVCVYAIDPFYNKSNSVCAATVDTYVLDLPVPAITVTAAANGYNVEYTLPTQSVFDAIDIVEYESPDATEPTGVTYSRVYFDNISPASVITLNTSSRWVKARFSSDGGVYTDFCAAQKVTPLAPVAVDTTGPSNVTSVSATHGIDTSGYLGFNGYVDISWPAVSDSTLRGYRIRFSNDGGATYTYANSPGAGTTYRLGGLAIGSTYKIAVATYDEFNNTSSNYVPLVPDILLNGTPSVSNYIEAGPFQFGVGVGQVQTNKGLYFDSSNYWYVNSSDSARLKVGGDLSNYILWDGAKFSIDGDITARGGSFNGNVSIVSGGSLYSGSVSGGSLTGAGYILNNSGITFSNGQAGSNLRQTTIAASTGLFTTNSANIGGWNITPGEIWKTQTGQGKISLNSTAGYISISNDGIENQTAGINSPTLSTDDVFWSGSNGPDGTAPFRVNLEGGLTASNATIKGTIRAVQGGFGTFDALNVITSGWTIDSNGMVASGEGRIKLGNYSIKSNNGTDFQVYDDTASTFVIQTNTANLATSDQNRVLLGNFDRQVEVVKSAQISGVGTVSSSTASSTAANAYRSGGLRNIFTNSSTQKHGSDASGVGITDYPSSIKGDILVYYYPDTPDTGPWRRIESMYLNTQGSNPVNSPVIATSSTLTTGNNGASVVVTSNNFATTVSTSDFTVNAGTTGLTLSSITNTSTSSKTLVFTGTVASGTLQITALASAFNPVASANSNTLNMVAGATYYYAEAVTDGEGGTCPQAPHYVSSTTVTPSIIDARFTVNVSVGSTTHGYYSSISSSDAVSSLLAALPLCQSVTPPPVTPPPVTPPPVTPPPVTPPTIVPVNQSLPVITPSSGNENDTFSVSTGTWTNSPTSYSYSWQFEEPESPDGWAPISGAVSSTYTPGPNFVESYGTHLACYVTATNASGSSSPVLTGFVTVNGTPSISVAPHLTISGSTMTSTAGTWNNYPTTYTYRWWRDDILQGQANSLLKTTSNTTSTTDTYNASNTNAYSVYTTVTAINATGSAVATSDNSIEYYTAPPPPPPPPVTPPPVTPPPVTPPPVTPPPVTPPPVTPPPVTPPPVTPPPVTPPPVTPPPVTPPPVTPPPPPPPSCGSNLCPAYVNGAWKCLPC